jgi:hypothetical protein
MTSTFRRTIPYPRFCLGTRCHIGSGGGALACPLSNRSIVSLIFTVESGRT